MARGGEEWAGQRLGRTPSAGYGHGRWTPRSAWSCNHVPHHVPSSRPFVTVRMVHQQVRAPANHMGRTPSAGMTMCRRDVTGVRGDVMRRGRGHGPCRASRSHRSSDSDTRVDGVNDDASRCRVTAGAHDLNLMRKTTPPPRAKETALASILEGGSELWGHDCVGPAAQRGRTKRCHVLCATVPVCATCVSHARE